MNKVYKPVFIKSKSKAFILFYLFFIFSANLFSQDCNIVSKANDILPDKLCAPVTVVWEVTYRGVNNNGTPVNIQFNWDDGNPVQIIPAINTNPNPLIREWKATITHVYPQNGPLCNYLPEATLMVNGVLCTSSVQQQNVTVWDTDDHNGGHLEINPVIFPICVGNDGTVTFQDVSLWNCVPPVELDNPNDPTRWTQWIYGTNYTINNVLVGGMLHAYPFWGAVVPAIGPVLGPQPPNNVSLPVYSPNTALVNQFFEVTLRNWNYCNPYDDPNIPGPPVDLVNGDYPPIITTAMVLIVPYPDATIQPVGPFCSNAPPVTLTAATPGGTWSGTGITNTTTGQFSPSVAGPGTHTITYTVVNANGCAGVGTINITVWARPTINILPGTNLQVCPGDTLFLDGNPTPGDGTIITHLWTGNTGPLSSVNIQTPYFTTNTPGTYNLTYRVTDSNGCNRQQSVVINVTQVTANITPDPAQACAGINFQLNGNPSGGTGTYISHLWSGNITYINFTNIVNPVFNCSVAGSYNLTYIVSDNNGCIGTDNITITVSPVPIANAGSDDSICGSSYTLNAIPSFGTGLWTMLNGPGTLNFLNSGSSLSNVIASQFGTYDLIWQETFGPGCTDQDTVKITFIQQPITNAGVDDTLCGMSTTLNALASVGNGYWSQVSGPGTTTFGNTTNPITNINVNAFGMYSYRWFENNSFGCIDADTVNISFDVVPNPNFSPVDTSGCPPFSVTHINSTIGGNSYQWYYSDGNQSTAINPTHIFSNSGTIDIIYYIKMIATSTYGCKDSVTHQLTVHPLPVSNFLHNGIPSCSPVTVGFTNISSGATNYIWDFGDGTPTLTSNNPTHTFYNNTTLIQYYEVKLIAYNSFGCPDTSVKYVTVYPDPNYTIDVIPDTACHPANIQFITQPGASSYLWAFGDGTTQSTGFTTTHPYSNTGSTDQAFLIQLIGTSFFGCVDTSYVPVLIRPKPAAIFTIQNSSGCSPVTFNFNNNSTGATINKWYWGDGTNEIQNNANISHNYVNTTSLPITIFVSLVVYNTQGCSDSTSLPIVIYPNVQSIFVADTSGCSPISVHFQNQSYGATTFYWDFNDGTTSTQTNPDHIFVNTTLTAINYNISLIATSVYNCTDTTNKLLTVYPKPTVDINILQSTGCTPFSAQFNNTSTGATTFNWNFGDNTTSTSPNTTINHTYTNITNNPITYTTSLIISNSYNCSDSSSLSIIVNPEVNAIFIADTASCSPLNSQFTNLSMGAINYQWNFGDGTSSTLFQPTHEYINPSSVDQTFSAVLTAISAYGCTDTYSVNINVWAKPNASYTVSPYVQIFPNSIITIDNTSTPGPWSYAWNFGDGNTSNVIEPLNHSYSSYGKYIISLLVYSAHCSDTYIDSVSINAPSPVASFSVNEFGCEPLTIQFSNQSLYSNIFTWDFGDGGISHDENPTYTYYHAGDYSVKLFASGPGGQDSIGGGTVKVYPKPIALFTVTPTVVFIPDQSIECNNNSVNADIYTWNFGDGNTSNLENPTHKYIQEGEYTITLIVSTIHQCSDTLSLFRAVVAKSAGQIDFPSAFSPNPSGSNGGHYNPNDFNNDIFHPVFVGVDTYELTIYNRWGELIFETKEPNIGWDGYYRDKLCKQDVYVWKAKGKFIDGQTFFKAGDVTLIR
ncbi:MAG: PKD domain-containing protein [Bacteroidia bacterium]|nr:PKD domain-containing protein [Bacteroidia bacterium]